MVCEAERAFPDETGGVLMGYWSKSDKEVIITHVIGPGPNALHKPEQFNPDSDYQEMEIARAYEESGRLWSYLGDWHSHPTWHTGVSRLDRRTLRTIACDVSARTPLPIMAILGKADSWTLQVWGYIPPRWLRVVKAQTEPLKIKIF